MAYKSSIMQHVEQDGIIQICKFFCKGQYYLGSKELVNPLALEMDI